MTEIDDLEVYEAICDAGDDGLSADELAERFDTDMWTMLDVCRKLKADRLVTSRPRKDSNLIVFVRREPDPPKAPWASSYFGTGTEPFI